MMNHYIKVKGQYYEQRNVEGISYTTVKNAWFPIEKNEIISKYGKERLKEIPSYQGFTNHPDNTRKWKENHNGYLNLYEPPDWPIKPGGFEFTMLFLDVVFGDLAPFIIEYIQNIHNNPRERLPILYLHGFKNHMGKKTLLTFFKWLDSMFSNAVMGGDFIITQYIDINHAAKNLVMVEESLSTINYLPILKLCNQMEKTAIQNQGFPRFSIDFFTKYMVLSSKTEKEMAKMNFSADTILIPCPIEPSDGYIKTLFQNDVIEKHPGEHILKSVLHTLESEIPAFLHYLESRKSKNGMESWEGFPVDFKQAAAMA